MKTFLLAGLVAVFVLAGSSVYIYYLNQITKSLDESALKIEALAENENWKACLKEVKNLQENWNKQKDILSAFTDHSELDQIKKTMNNLAEGVRFQDLEETLLHAKEFRILTDRMRENEYPTIENIL